MCGRIDCWLISALYPSKTHGKQDDKLNYHSKCFKYRHTRILLELMNFHTAIGDKLHFKLMIRITIVFNLIYHQCNICYFIYYDYKNQRINYLNEHT